MKPTLQSLFTSALVFCLLIGTCACHKDVHEIEPDIYYIPQKRVVQCLPKVFPPLQDDEILTPWGRELAIADSFADEMDLYRAITSFKRARVLLPLLKQDRRNQIDYSIMLCYYFARKYDDVLLIFNESCLNNVGCDFPAFRNLLIILYDSYYKENEFIKACQIWDLLEEHDADTAKELRIGTAIETANITGLYTILPDSADPCFHYHWLHEFQKRYKNPATAQTLNALLPGAGYLYVGQKKTALTSFILNALFIWGTWQFFDRGYIPAGIFTLSLEAGWYVGGINGAGLAAKAYNQALYNDIGKEAMVQRCLFPVLKFEYGF